MKNIKTKLLSVSAAALVTSSFASAAVQQLNNTWYAITYSAVFEQSQYTTSQPLNPLGSPDANHTLGPGGNPVHGIPATPVIGTGFLNIATGEIRLDPIAWEENVTGGSYGFADWSQTLRGSFNGNIFAMTTSATVNSGTLLCELSTSNACTSQGGVGSLASALRPPQTFSPTEADEDGNPIDGSGQPLVHVNAITFSAPIAPGVTGQYLYQGDVAPAYEDTTIDITVGNVVFVPVPAAAWLFAPSLLGLVAGKRLCSRKNKA